MDKQKKRISEFLDGIIDRSLPAEQQITLFSQEEDVDGAGSTNSGCTNKASSCNGSSNSTCTNYDTYCDVSDNKNCTALINACDTNGAACVGTDLYLGCGGTGGDS